MFIVKSLLFSRYLNAFELMNGYSLYFSIPKSLNCVKLQLMVLRKEQLDDRELE